MQSSSDIAAWIEERKKRFATKARAAEAAERKRQHQEAQQAANLARKETQAKQRAEKEEARKKKLGEEQIRKQKKSKENTEDVAAKAKRKVEKLRKQLEKEERRAAKAEAKASKNKVQDGAEGCCRTATDDSHNRQGSHSNGSESGKFGEANIPKLPNPLPMKTTQETAVWTAPAAESDKTLNETAIQDSALATSQETKEAALQPIPDPLTPTSQPAAPDDHTDPPLSTAEGNSGLAANSLPHDSNPAKGDESPPCSIDKASQNSSISMSDSSSDISSTDSEDLTSSSGSSSSDIDSGDDAPEQVSSRRSGPQRVAAPRREKPRQICRDFLKNGRCKRGDDCRFRHELPERGSRDNPIKEVSKFEKRTERVSLHQRVSTIVRFPPTLTFMLIISFLACGTGEGQGRSRDP